MNDAGGVVTIDVALFRDGSIDAQQLATLKAMSAGLKKHVPGGGPRTSALQPFEIPVLESK